MQLQLPNVASLALIAAVVAALEFVAAGAEGLGNAWWIPALVLVAGMLAKAGQVYLQAAKAATPEARSLAPGAQPSKVRSWLLD